MRELTLVKPGRLEWLEVPEPTLTGEGDALVRPLVVARCDLDPVTVSGGFSRLLRAGLAVHVLDPCLCEIVGTPAYAPPFPVGHECVAEVVACAPGVRSVKVGQRVVVPFQVACGACAACQRGLTSRCSATGHSVTTYGFGQAARRFGGMLTDLLRVPYADAMLVPLPEGVDPRAAASASDNLPDAYRSVAPALRARPGATVLVVGGAAASIGLYAAGIAKALGASLVDYWDTSRERLAIAERLGVGVLDGNTRSLRAPCALPRRYAISVDARSDARGRGLELALRSLEPGGICTSVGIYPAARTPLPLMQMYVDGLTLTTGISNARVNIPAVLGLLAEGRFDPRLVTTRVAPWESAHEALHEKTTKLIVARD
ncbi:MAG: alcohol dehydrogenase catalytic domain-containing protein [Deltaproteobacteria bacterium]